MREGKEGEGSPAVGGPTAGRGLVRAEPERINRMRLPCLVARLLHARSSRRHNRRGLAPSPMSISPQQPFLPKLRPLDIRRVTHQGQAFFLFRDPLGLNDDQVLVPQAWAPFLVLCDGSRDISSISAALELQTGVRLAPAHLEGIFNQLGDALLLDDLRFAAALAKAERQYRSAPYRRPALAGKAYPEDPEELARTFVGYGAESASRAAEADSVAGVISPHIDYQRGGQVYAAVWQRAARAIRGAELVIVFGTDHNGGPGKMTLTRQSYATPWGILPTDLGVVDRLAGELGADVFEEELHHRNEHSIELATVWLHYFMRPRACPIVPVLCGSFHHFVEGREDPATNESFETALRVLAEESAGRRTLVVAAADLAHVGPVFGDGAPYGAQEREQLRAADEGLVQAINQADATGFFDRIRQERDSRRICGMPPIYLTLRMLQGATGEATGYDQCPADADGGSLVSITGAILRKG